MLRMNKERMKNIVEDKSMNILVVQSDAKMASLEKDYLEINGYRATICSDGKTALQEAVKGAYNLILVDLELPDMEGAALCHKLRKMFDIPIVIITPEGKEEEKIRGLGMGADDYIDKNASPTVLIAVIKANLAQYNRLLKCRENTDSILQLGDITVNTDTHRCYVKGAEITLTHKEYELLLFLLQNEDVVFSKETLYEQIWGFEAIGDTATVAVHINRLREKIEQEYMQPHYIQTVWGVGYRLSSKSR